ncbi:MAG: glutaminase [Anaerolineae bacterium]|jgi:glutaminase|nr:glutaminase [Anaerolineae bacterium]MBT7073192.1 glutaminase [Anaerolineae bacterium]MBT7326239.1 glutaminase [Anaerolineae bacterium]
MNYSEILKEIYAEVQPLLTQGQVADYIPELAHIPPTKFGMAILTSEGEQFQIGEASEKFSIQSISKLFTLTLAMRLEGDAIWQRIGREPSGTAFNSLVQLEYENGIPRNPFINAGALVVTDMILSHACPPGGLDNAHETVLDFLRKLAQNAEIGFDLDVARSERSTGYRNIALANFIKSFGNLRNEPDKVLDAYFHHCSIAMTCSDLARAGLFLANKGRLPWNDEEIIKPNQAKYIKSLMLTCGTYDSVGDFAYRVGLPGKSGVGGGILAVMPGEFSVCVWSPRLNENGNSLAGTKALELLTTLTGISVF